MNFSNFITSQTGFVHFIASIFALILGTCILYFDKGTLMHKKLGKLYALIMVIVLITAFMTYRLFGNWGMFHWAAVVSSLTLLAGLLPIYLKRPIKSYIIIHFSFMYWSVLGLYGAFVSEVLVRLPKVVLESGIPNHFFYNMIGVGTSLVMGLGVYFFIKYKPKWEQDFKHYSK